MIKSQIDKLDSLLTGIGYSKIRCKTGIYYIQGFFNQVKKHPKNVTEADIEEYLKKTKNSHMKFWVRFFYSDLLINFKILKFTRLEKRLKAMGFDGKDVIYCLEYIRNLCHHSHKPMSRITKEDVNGYIRSNNITGDELLKVQSISKIFLSKAEGKNKVIFLNKKKEFLKYDDVKEKLSNTSDIRGLIERARKINKHYCIKINTMVKVCRMPTCEFYAYSCLAQIPLTCEAHAPINFPDMPVPV